MTVVLGVDIATRVTGFCVGAPGTMPRCGAWCYPHTEASLGALAKAFRADLQALYDETGFQFAAYEAPILTPHDVLPVLRKIYGMGMVLEEFCDDRHIPIGEVGLRIIKREIAGDSSAKKKTMVDVARRVGLTLPPGRFEGRVIAEDATDAFGAWLIGVRKHDKPASAAWDSRVAMARTGGLI